MLARIWREVKEMANTVRSATAKFNLDTLTDAELDTIIANTQAQVASTNRFLTLVTNERVRRGLRLPQRRNLDDDVPAQF